MLNQLIEKGKVNIIAAYENSMGTMPEFDEGTFLKSKRGNYTIIIRDIDDSDMHIFHLMNKK